MKQAVSLNLNNINKNHISSQNDEIKIQNKLNKINKNINSIWHYRLGYISQKILSILNLNNKNNLNNVDFKKLIDPTYYKIYISSNLNSKRNKVLKNDKLYYLDKINSDIIGPINPPSLGGSKYIVTFLDSITKYLKIEILSNKLDIFISYKKFKLRAKNSVNNRYTIKILKTDNSKEYINNKFKIYLENKGTLYHKSAPYLLEQNSEGEHINRTLFRKIRILLNIANIPIPFWAKAAEVAIYLYNITPYSALDFKSPYKARFNKKLLYNNIYIFGSTAYFKTPKVRLISVKLSYRSEKGILIGYSLN